MSNESTRVGVRSDYEFVEVVSRPFLYWNHPERGDMFLPIDPDTRTLEDGWDEVLGNDLGLLHAKREHEIVWEYADGKNGSETLIKHVTFVTKACPECSIPGDRKFGWVDDHGDDICPDCGMVLNGSRKEMYHEDWSFQATRGSGEPSGKPALTDPAPYHPTTDTERVANAVTYD